MEVVGLPARLEDAVVHAPGGARVQAKAPLEGYYVGAAVGPGVGHRGIRAGLKPHARAKLGGRDYTRVASR